MSLRKISKQVDDVNYVLIQILKELQKLNVMVEEEYKKE